MIKYHNLNIRNSQVSKQDQDPFFKNFKLCPRLKAKLLNSILWVTHTWTHKVEKTETFICWFSEPYVRDFSNRFYPNIPTCVNMDIQLGNFTIKANISVKFNQFPFSTERVNYNVNSTIPVFL